MKQKTKDYNLFNIIDSNRQIDEKLVKKIKSSIESKNLLEFRPILVDKNFNVIDGQHRLKAAEELQIDIYYEVKKDLQSTDIILLNENQKNWTTYDYFHYYLNEGFEEYILLDNFIRRNDLNIMNSLYLLSNMSRSKMKQYICSGKFKFPDSNRIIEVENNIKYIKGIIELLLSKLPGNKAFLKRPTFLNSLIEFITPSIIDKNIFYRKILLRIDLICSRSTRYQYILLFREIYNYKNSAPVDISDIFASDNLRKAL